MFFIVFEVAGGLALFIYGMNLMTSGLRQAAGGGLRRILAGAGRSRLTGFLVGGGMGVLAHSSATTVMLVGFVNAGLMTLPGSIPAVIGSNVGTTLSMQAVSLNLSAYCYVAMVCGFIVTLVAPDERWKHVGRGLLGFGLLFLGMETMSGAIRPHRAALAPLLERVDGTTLPGILVGVLVATGLTAVWQSSGATIGLCFALAQAGVFTRFDQVFPIVLGAHIGTCATGLLGSIGTHIEARRVAGAHLLFNLGNVALAIAMRPIIFVMIDWFGGSLVRQTANLHTLVMVLAAVPALPLSGQLARLLRKLLPSKAAIPQSSFLKLDLLATPETAIVASIRELQRTMRICISSFRLVADVMLFSYQRNELREVAQNELAVNEIKTTMQNYLRALTRRRLSRRQAILVQHINRCIIEIERIGDHILVVEKLSLQREKRTAAMVDEDAYRHLFNLYRSAEHVLHLVVDSLDVDREDFQHCAQEILQATRRHAQLSLNAKALYAERMQSHDMTALAGLYLAEIVASFDRLVQHARVIALAERHSDFWIKRKKLDRPVPLEDRVHPPPPLDPNDFLDRLQEENYL